MLASAPSPDPVEVSARLALTRDLMARRAVRPPVILGGLDEGAALLHKLGAQGRALDPEDLLDLFVLCERSEGARTSFPIEDAPDLDLPALSELIAPLTSFEDLLVERDVIFERDGRIKDTASPKLAAIRGAIVRLRRDLVRRLEEYARTRGDALADDYVTEKDGRYCLPVRSDRRDLVAGIVHHKSGSGQTFFVEPLAVVDANNELAEAFEEEREEIHRILVALTSRFSVRRADLATSAGILTSLDVAQAKAEMAQRTDAIFPEPGDRLELVGARHPLLDRRLSALREEVFGEDAEGRHSDAVPLDIVMPEGIRTLLISGPNAGGKTVAMKTAGLFALLNQSGFAIPSGAGSRLPVFDQILIVAGDAQDLLGDLSSFAAAMTRTARVLAEASEKSLVLLDELGSGTDPDEGGAIAIAVLEEDLARGGLSVATTHLASVKEWGNGVAEVLTAAMEFDEAKGQPTFRIRPGAVGRSRALAVAEKAGLPERVLAAAKSRLGAGWAAVDTALERLERERLVAEAELARAKETALKADARLAAAERERDQLVQEKARLREKMKADLDRALEALREKTRREIDRLRDEAQKGRALSRSALTTVLHAAREEAEAHLPVVDPPPSGPVAVGDTVRISPFKTTGRLLSIDAHRGEAEVEVSGKKMRVAVGALSRLSAGAASKAARETAAVSAPAGSGARELVLVGQRIDDAIPEIERAINDALLSGIASLRVVHGYGTGRLAAAVKEFLTEHPGVSSHRPGDANEGGNAVTIARLDV